MNIKTFRFFLSLSSILCDVSEIVNMSDLGFHFHGLLVYMTDLV